MTDEERAKLHREIEVFYKGQHYTGTWASTDSHGPLAFTLDNGNPLTLPPGLVWIDVTQ